MKKYRYILIVVVGLIIFLAGCSGSGLSPGFSNVYGTIVTEDAELPVTGARVKLGEKETTTDSDGYYSFSNIPSGTYLFQVTAEDYYTYEDVIYISGSSYENLGKTALSYATGYDSISGSVTLSNSGEYRDLYKTLNNSSPGSSIDTNIMSSQTRYKNSEVLIKYKPTVSSQSIASITAEANLTSAGKINTGNSKVIRYKVPPGKTVEEVVNKYNQKVEVEYAEPNYIYHATAKPDDDYYSSQWGHLTCNLEAVWDRVTGDSQITVAVVDTGIDLNHPDLEDNISYLGMDYVNNDGDPDDLNGHGTHVAGIIGAVANNDRGIAGTNWNVELLPVRVLDEYGIGDLVNIADGINYAVNHDADIINLSLGAPSYSETLHDAIINAVDNGVIVIAATGNGENGSTPILYPARHSETIAVGAVDSNNVITDYSNYGSNVDLVAPGGTDSSGIYSTYKGSTYGYMSGTSMATPYVSGIAALLLADGINPYYVRERLTGTAVDLGNEGKDNYYGYGLVDAYGALLGKKLKNPYIFAADINNYVIDIKSEVKIVALDNKKEGSFDLEQVDLYGISRANALVGWRDVNENNVVDGGDYYGQTAISTYTTHEDINMYYVEDSSPYSGLEVKGMAQTTN